MAFAVKNLGVVKQGTLTQQPLTVLCGPNNNGKTWVMYSLYYYHKLITSLGENDLPGRNLLDLSKIIEIINKDLADVFNTSRDLLKNASFSPQLSAEQLTDQIQNIRKTFLMPAERAGLHLFYRELGTRRTALLHHASLKTTWR